MKTFFKEKKIIPCDFGQYNDLWEHHRSKCKKIIRITNNYIVFIEHSNNIDWESTNEHDDSFTVEEKGEKEKSLSQCSIIEHKPLEGLSESSILSFKTVVGEAIVNCLEKNFEDAQRIWKQAEDYRIDRVIEKSRAWYLMFTMFIYFIILVLAALICSNQASNCEPLLENLLFGLWGVTGALLSVILRSGNMLNSSISGWGPHFLESISRLIVGFISGQIIYLGIKSGILFANLSDSNQIQFTVSFLALLAGASERFAPSIIEKIEKTSSAT